MKINKVSISRNNLITVASYNALFYENKHRQKALISFTLGDEKLNSLFKLRKELLSEIRKTMKRVVYKGEKIAYFSNIELGASKGELTTEFNPHIHFQFFYENYEPIKKALAIIEEKFVFNNFDVQTSENNEAYLGYIIKDYLESKYDENLERNKKQLGGRKKFHTSSRKSLSNYVIRYIYNFYKNNNCYKWNKLKARKRYEFILNNIKNGKIIIKSLNEKTTAKFKVVKNYKIYIKP